MFVTAVIENFNITLVTQTLKRDEKQFELAGVLVIGVNWKIQFVMLKIDILLIFSTSVLVQYILNLFLQKLSRDSWHDKAFLW